MRPQLGDQPKQAGPQAAALRNSAILIVPGRARYLRQLRQAVDRFRVSKRRALSGLTEGGICHGELAFSGVPATVRDAL